MPAFYITAAVMLFGKLSGFIGMVAGVPLFATIYYLVKRLVEYSLKQQGKPVDTASYIEEEKREISPSEKQKKKGRSKEKGKTSEKI